MAFNFFRRRQKMVMIIMAILMVSFLIGFQGLERILPSRQEKDVRGHSAVGDITTTDRQQAEADLQILAYVLGSSELEKQIGSNEPAARGYKAYVATEYFKYGAISTEQLSWYLLMGGSDEEIYDKYAMLLKDAVANSIEASDAEISGFMARAKLDGKDQMKKFLADLRTAGHKITEKQFRHAIGNWLMIYKHAMAAVNDVPPSEAMIKLAFRDANEKIDLAVVKVDAQKIAEAITTKPSDDQISKQYNEYASVPEGSFQDANSMGFGYQVPSKARVAYLYLSKRAVERAAAYQYLKQRPGEIVTVGEEVATAPSTKPGSATATATATAGTPPATAATEPQTTWVTKTARLDDLPFGQALPAIEERLDPKVVDAIAARVIAKAEAIRAELLAKGVAPENLYQQVVEQMMVKSPALDAKIKTSFESMRLDRAMKLLAGEAGLEGIAFPWDRHGKLSVKPDVRVRLRAGENTTLAVALADIAQQVGYDKYIKEWRLVDRIDGVLYPVPVQGKEVDFLDMVDFAPLSAQATDLLTSKELSKHDILSNAAGTNEMKMVQQVFMAEPFGRAPERFRQVKVNEDNKAQVAIANPFTRQSEPKGQILWRLIEGAPRHTAGPSDLNEAMTERVIKDIKLQQAMRDASSVAESLATAAKADGLEKGTAAATQATQAVLTDMDVIHTGLFSRAQQVPNLELSPKDSEDQQIARLIHQEFTKKAFGLAPVKVEPTEGGYGLSEPAIVPLPAMQAVYVIQRTGFTPAYESQLEAQKPMYVSQLTKDRVLNSLAMWFAFEGVSNRLEFKRGQ